MVAALLKLVAPDRLMVPLVLDCPSMTMVSVAPQTADA